MMKNETLRMPLVWGRIEVVTQEKYKEALFISWVLLLFTAQCQRNQQIHSDSLISAYWKLDFE